MCRDPRRSQLAGFATFSSKKGPDPVSLVESLDDAGAAAWRLDSTRVGEQPRGACDAQSDTESGTAADRANARKRPTPPSRSSAQRPGPGRTAVLAQKTVEPARPKASTQVCGTPSESDSKSRHLRVEHLRDRPRAEEVTTPRLSHRESNSPKPRPIAAKSSSRPECTASRARAPIIDPVPGNTQSPSAH